MNVSLNWLSSHLDLTGKTIEQLDDLLTFAGVEVEGIQQKGVGSDLVVVAEIKEATQHPNADRLKVTQVDAGEGSLRQIVCGATNYQVGDRVPCALPGAILPGGFAIGETVMRKVESRGMLCAASEIGLPDAEDGLLILPPDAPIGQAVKSLFDSDVLLELEVTPNRPDLLSHRGMARELSALLGTPLKPLNIPARNAVPAEPSSIRLDDAEACPFYSAVRISGVRVQASPNWLQRRLEAVGLRAVNNIVDVTNFVLHELGQPLHAFDAACVTGAIVVRGAAAGEMFLALDGSEHRLTRDDLLISDAAGSPLALAGVMGGAASGVTAATTDIILESAWFAPQGIRRTSRRTALMSDSSYRFERGVDPQAVLPASSLAVKLILELAGGQAEELTSFAGNLPVLTQAVSLDLAKLDQLMGGAIAHEDAGAILQRLGLKPLSTGAWEIPSYRADLQRHIDLVEEIARVHGLAKVPSRLRGSFVPISPMDSAYDADSKLAQRLAALGYFECQTIKLIASDQLRDALPLRALQDGDLIRVKSPLSEDHAIMRPSVVPGLVASAARNIRQQVKSLRFFEVGRVFRNAGGGKAKDQEADVLGVLLAGPVAPEAWNQAERIADLQDLKGLIAALLPNQAIQFVPRAREGFVLSCDVKAGSQTIGVAARMLPSRERDEDFQHPVFVAELDLSKLRKLMSANEFVTELPQFPSSSRDAAMEVSAELSNSEIENCIAKVNHPLLVSFGCFDVFSDPSGERLAADRKSIAYHFHYRAADRTLKTEEVDEVHRKVLDTLTEKLGVKFR